MVIKKVSLEELRNNKETILKGLKLKDDSEIDYSDIPELDLNDPTIWETVKVCSPIRKKNITIRGKKKERSKKLKGRQRAD